MLILILGLTIALLDQVTKELVRAHFLVGDLLPIIPGFFNLTYVRNTGAAWGMMSGLNGWLIVLSVIMLAVLVIFRRSFLTDTVTHRIASGLMIAGIIGNLIDRLRLGYVVDFLDFHLAESHFPSFNVADSAICIGVTLYILSQVFGGDAHRVKPAVRS